VIKKAGPLGKPYTIRGIGGDGSRRMVDSAAKPTGDPYDLVVVGGGIIGSGVARDAAMRGLRVALVEKKDYAWGTTARSTRLIHGGLRYLEHYDFALVREALRERAVLMQNAGHLVERVPFLFPVFKGKGRGRWMLKAGMWLYDLFARRNLGGHGWVKREEVVRVAPCLDRPDLRGAYRYWDAQVRYPERLVIENIVDLWRHGGASWNHTTAVGLEQEGRRVTGVRVVENESQRHYVVPARFVLNIGGPWVTEVDNRFGMGDPALTRRTKGVHLLVDRMMDEALVLQCGDGERIVFLVPWGPYTIIGTTDTDYTGPNDRVEATQKDVEYLLDETNANLDVALTPQDVHYTWAGLRSLIPQGKGTAGSVSRRHLVVRHQERGGPENLVSVVGGKITSFRFIAQDIVDHILGDLGAEVASRTLKAPLPGGEKVDRLVLLRELGARLPHHTDPDVDRLFSLYGARVKELLQIAAEGETGHLVKGSRLTREEVRFVVEREGARTVEDVLLRRTMLGMEADQGLPVVQPVAEEMGKLLGWDDARVRAEVQLYRQEAARARRALVALAKSYDPRAPDVSYARQIA
jgi:glycerol-3-phosphate dehydrogenase